MFSSVAWTTQHPAQHCLESVRLTLKTMRIFSDTGSMHSSLVAGRKSFREVFLWPSMKYFVCVAKNLSTFYYTVSWPLAYHISHFVLWLFLQPVKNLFYPTHSVLHTLFGWISKTKGTERRFASRRHTLYMYKLSNIFFLDGCRTVTQLLIGVTSEDWSEPTYATVRPIGGTGADVHLEGAGGSGCLQWRNAFKGKLKIYPDLNIFNFKTAK